MMSVKPLTPLNLDWSNRIGSRPKIVAGLHLNPTSGAAEISSPHHAASTGRWLPNPPNVRNTVVAPFMLTFTPVGFTRTCAEEMTGDANSSATTSGRRTNRSKMSERIETYSAVERPVFFIRGIAADSVHDRCAVRRLSLIPEEDPSRWPLCAASQQSEVLRQLRGEIRVVAFRRARIVAQPCRRNHGRKSQVPGYTEIDIPADTASVALLAELLVVGVLERERRAEIEPRHG